MTPSEVLERAAVVLERDGWCKGTLRDDEGRHCALGAILVAEGEKFPFHTNEGWKARTALEVRVGTNAAKWNDSRRQATVVIRTLRETARELKKGTQ